MSAHRLVTGVFRMPDGTVFANRSLIWLRSPRRTLAQGGAVVVDQPFTIQTDSAGAITGAILPGTYLVILKLSDADRHVEIGIPEGEGAFDVADGIAAGQAVITPELVLQAQLARDEAVQARDALGEIGTAATRDVTGSVDDVTPGRVLTTGAGAAQAFRRGNILGDVSQSDGLPTGAVIQRGSNANGAFVRFADGLQICTITNLAMGPANIGSGPLFRTDTVTWSFPAIFAAAPVCVGQGATTVRWLAPGNATLVDVPVRLLTTFSDGSTSDARLAAIGRWF